MSAPALRGRVVSLQVGRPAPLPWRGRVVSTAIVKAAVRGPLELGPDGFPGDEQGDLVHHGGPDKAVCAYPVEHVPSWEAIIDTRLPGGAFGENLSVRGLVERDVHIGDVFAIGRGARVQVSQPRGPCFKLAARWGLRELPRRMAREGSSGFYLRVLEPGAVGAGDGLRLLQRTSDVSVAEVMRVTYRDRRDFPALARVLAVPELADQWRQSLLERQRRGQLPLPFGTDDS